MDGNDIFAVREAMKRAREMAVSEEGGKPVLIEAMSYRVSHHSTSDDSFAYRAKVEVEDWKRRDNPITRLRKWMEQQPLDSGGERSKSSQPTTNGDNKLWSSAQDQDLRSSIRKEVLAAFSRAEAEEKPALREMFTDVYEELSEEAKAQREELKSVLERYPEEYDEYLRGHEGGLGGL